MIRVLELSLACVLIEICGPNISLHAQGANRNGIFEIGAGITPPKLTHKVEPKYSRAAAEAGVQGTVLLRIVIDEHGLPKDITVVSPLGFGLDEAAVKCVYQWRFRAARKGNKPIKVWANGQINFRIRGKKFDSQAEAQRTKYNKIISRITRFGGGKPSDKDLKGMQRLANHEMPAAEYAIGKWEMEGNGLPKDVSAGLANIRMAGKWNYGPALLFLGESEMRGIWVPKNPTKGLSLMRRAARVGDREAQLTLGEIYEKGVGVTTDVHQAERYYRLCAGSGSPDCQLRLGKLLLGLPHPNERDRLQAIAWLEIAGSHKLVAAQEIADSDMAKLTPRQTKQVQQLRRSLEHAQEYR
jgi:TonB family protein